MATSWCKLPASSLIFFVFPLFIDVCLLQYRMCGLMILHRHVYLSTVLLKLRCEKQVGLTTHVGTFQTKAN